jgi:hypothetical protein
MSGDKRYPCIRVPAGTKTPSVDVVVLEDSPQVKKVVTKRYPDGRTLSLFLVDEKIVEKSLTYRSDFNLVAMKAEREKGGLVTFKYWQKGGLEVSLTYFGPCLVGKMFTLNFEKISPSILRPEDWRDEIANDIAFPTVNVDKIPLSEGYSSEEKENPYLAGIMYADILQLIVDDENRKADDRLVVVVDDEVACVKCDFCGDTPCVWLVEKDRVIANDMAENGTPVTVVNSTRRKLAFRYMFRVINAGPGRQGVRKKLPECVENGVRELFPDLVYMGFKEN